jgi:hypothetical protein
MDKLFCPLYQYLRRRAQTSIPRAGYETTNSADGSRMFVVAAFICHSCTAIRTVRQPWTVSLSGYNISRLPHSRARGIEMCARRRGSAVQVAEWRLNTSDISAFSRLIQIGLDILITALGVGPSLKGSWVSFGHYVRGFAMCCVMRNGNVLVWRYSFAHNEVVWEKRRCSSIHS